MKTKLLFILLFLYSFIDVNSQSKVGFHLGVNFSNAKVGSTDPFATNIKYKSSANVGPLFGFMADIPIFSGLHLRPELNYIRKGSKVEQSYLGITNMVEYKYLMNYISLPVVICYNFQIGTDSKIFVGFGPEVSYGISGKLKWKANGTSDQTDIKFDGKKDAEVTDDDLHLKGFETGLASKVGLQSAFGAYLEFGYNFGLTNIAPDDYETWKNKGLFLKLGYSIGGKKEKEKTSFKVL